MSQEEDKRKIKVKDKTLREVGAILRKHAYREQDPVMLAVFWEGRRITGFLQFMYTTADGKRLPDLLNRGTFEAYTRGNEVYIVFRLGHFPGPGELFWQTVDKLSVALGVVAKKRGPTYKTIERAGVFKSIKDKHLEWGQNRVAMVAMEENPWLGEISGETVRYTYKAMGWEWERSDRIR